MSVHFTNAQIARLSALISVLLSPLDADSIDEWRRDACRALGTLVGGEVSVLDGPRGGGIRPRLAGYLPCTGDG